MGRNLSLLLRQELANLEKDAESRKSAMKALKSYVKDLDSKSIPLFLAQVSETKESCSSSGEYTISLYEVLARFHGPNIVSQIDNIMSTIVKTLTSSAGSIPLHQACSNVVPAIARYGMDPSTPEDEKRKIIHTLCKPLSDSLLSSQEDLASGAALCLKSLVDCENWQFASDELVNEVCLRVAGALEEKHTQTNSHMGLAMSLAKHNSHTVEAYARSLLRSGLQILNAGVKEGNSQKRLSAVQMVNFLMKCVNPQSIFSELGIVIEEMEKCHSDQKVFVRVAAFEALQTARTITVEKGSRFKDPGPIIGLNFSRGRENSRRQNIWGARDQSTVSVSPESQTLDSFIGDDSFAESPNSTGQGSCHFNYGHRCTNQKLWRNENGEVDMALKDGSYSEMDIISNVSNPFFERFGGDELSDKGDHSEVFSRFIQANPTNGIRQNAISIPQREHSQLNFDDIKILATPRKLIYSLQDPHDTISDYSEKQARCRRPVSSLMEWSSTRIYDRDGVSNDLNYETKGNENLSKTGEQEQDSFQPVSSTGGIPADTDPEVSRAFEDKLRVQSQNMKRRSVRNAAFNLVPGLFFILLTIIMSLVWIDNQKEGFYLVPT